MTVHREIGNGFPEIIYQRCLALEFEAQGMQFSREKSFPIFYRNKEVGKRRLDFLIEDKVLVEPKAVSDLDNIHLAQALNYLKVYHQNVGLLINFWE